MGKRRNPGEQAANFMSANDKSPVIAGRAIESDPSKPGKGGVYTLANGERHRLGLAACRMLSDGYPKWLYL